MDILSFLYSKFYSSIGFIYTMISKLEYILKFIIKSKNKPKIPFIASQDITV